MKNFCLERWGCFAILAAVALIESGTCDWYSSVDAMEELIKHENEIISIFHKYIDFQETKLQKLKEFVRSNEEILLKAKQNMSQYLGHPINQFKLIQRLIFEQQEAQLINEGHEFLDKILFKPEQFPMFADLEGASKALIRLLDTYQLDINELTQGIIKGFIATQHLNANDCFYIGRVAYLGKNYNICVLWMTEAQNMDKNSYSTFTVFDLLDHLAFCLMKQGNVQEAYELTKQLLQLDQSNQRIAKNLQYYKDALNHNNETVSNIQLLSEDQTRYMEICRHTRKNIPPSVLKRLKCYLWTNGNHPRLLLKPAKVEELWHEPQLLRFHHFVSNSEMDAIKAFGLSKLERSRVSHTRNGAYSDQRISKNAWLPDSDSVATRISQRISDVSGLSMETAELLQVANYGMGGQYEPHLDSTEKENPPFFPRIATVLIYLSDVAYGGSTAFTKAGVAAEPIKGSAVFWFNLNRAGKVDESTMHAGCPVVIGTKWIANKWLGLKGQELVRPCLLSPHAKNRLF
ncbi:prolyl 4-hydroxylase subunit alpha-1-like isoform X1 [Clavelina lepadiformis]|uniref:prolyl 4-hydroxylase subunit alpha-1-like isoform X1 n=1 Tax=Clavelina lepadiformis TaxID=159417 RepID=UPI0040414310